MRSRRTESGSRSLLVHGASPKTPNRRGLAFSIPRAALAIALIIYPIIFAAMNRAVQRPADDRFGYLRLGADELAQMGLMLILVAIAIAAYLTAIVVAVLMAMAVGTAVAVAALVVGLVGAFAFLGVRLSLASALTFATGKIRLADAWALTSGRFWPILSAYALTLALAALVWFLGLAVITAMVAVAGGGAGALTVMVRPDFGSMGALFSPPRLVYLASQAALSGLLWPLMFAPPMTIYRSLMGGAGRTR